MSLLNSDVFKIRFPYAVQLLVIFLGFYVDSKTHRKGWCSGTDLKVYLGDVWLV
jgi:hypothetical protein